MENIGKKIKQYRKSANLTQKQLAQKCGYATGTIQQYELGKRSPRLPQLLENAKALNIPVSVLLDTSWEEECEKEYSRKEKRRLQYLQCLGYKIVLHDDNSFDIYCDGYKYSIPHKDPEAYYDVICEVVDSAAQNIIEENIEKYSDTEEEE